MSSEEKTQIGEMGSLETGERKNEQKEDKEADTGEDDKILMNADNEAQNLPVDVSNIAYINKIGIPLSQMEPLQPVISSNLEFSNVHPEETLLENLENQENAVNCGFLEPQTAPNMRTFYPVYNTDSKGPNSYSHSAHPVFNPPLSAQHHQTPQRPSFSPPSNIVFNSSQHAQHPQHLQHAQQPNTVPQHPQLINQYTHAQTQNIGGNSGVLRTNAMNAPSNPFQSGSPTDMDIVNMHQRHSPPNQSLPLLPNHRHRNNMGIEGVICEHLDLLTFKTRPCKMQSNHMPKRCPFYHDFKKDRRRPPTTYSDEMCAYSLNGKECPMGDSCPNCHNRVEEFYHPSKYKTKFCSSYPHILENCEYGPYCCFAHSESDIKIDLICKFTKDSDFYLFHFKTVWCPFNENNHAREQCVYAHNWQDFRRKPYAYNYEKDQCQTWDPTKIINVYTDGCPNDMHCKCSHGWKEQEYHPTNYKMNHCRHGENCNKPHCPYYHSERDRRYGTDTVFKLVPRNRITSFRSQCFSTKQIDPSETGGYMRKSSDLYQHRTVNLSPRTANMYQGQVVESQYPMSSPALELVFVENNNGKIQHRHSISPMSPANSYNSGNPIYYQNPNQVSGIGGYMQNHSQLNNTSGSSHYISGARGKYVPFTSNRNPQTQQQPNQNLNQQQQQQHHQQTKMYQTTGKKYSIGNGQFPQGMLQSGPMQMMSGSPGNTFIQQPPPPGLSQLSTIPQHALPYTLEPSFNLTNTSQDTNTSTPASTLQATFYKYQIDSNPSQLPLLQHQHQHHHQQPMDKRNSVPVLPNVASLSIAPSDHNQNISSTNHPSSSNNTAPAPLRKVSPASSHIQPQQQLSSLNNPIPFIQNSPPIVEHVQFSQPLPTISKQKQLSYQDAQFHETQLKQFLNNIGLPALYEKFALWKVKKDNIPSLTDTHYQQMGITQNEKEIIQYAIKNPKQ
jgi:hypothetical protein